MLQHHSSSLAAARAAGSRLPTQHAAAASSPAPGRVAVGVACTARPVCLGLIRGVSSSRRQTPSVRAAAAAAGNHSNHNSNSSDQHQQWEDEDSIWSQLAFPTYLQSKSKHTPEVCRDFAQAVTAAERRQAREQALLLGGLEGGVGGDAAAGAGAVSGSMMSYSEDEDDEDLEPETAWHTIRREAERDAAAEPLLSSFLYASILAHDTFERALAFVLSNRLANAVMLPTQLFEIFHEVLVAEPDVREGALADVEACRERDPACTSYSQALLYYKGYHAIQTHRIAHALWVRGQKVMAVALQSRMSEVLAVDIHPAARFGRGILLDHGTGVVIGETAVVGNNVSLLQNVTLGGTGKDHGDRHPKISDNVLIGACATVLGNIRVGEGAQIAAGSLVLKPVAPHTMVAGSPAKPVGNITGNPAEKMQQWSKKLLNWDPFNAEQQQPQQPTAPQTQQQQPHTQQQQPPAAAAAPPADTAAARATPAASSSSSGAKSDSSSSSKSMPSLPKPTRATVAEAEAAWDAIAARAMAAGVCATTTTPAATPTPSSSSGVGAGVGGVSSGSSSNGSRAIPINGAASNITPLSNGSSSSIGSRAIAGSSNGSSRAAGGVASSSSTSSGARGAVGARKPVQPPLPPAAGAPAAAPAGRKQASADLRGIHEGDVEATLDEEVAAEKWAGKKEEPEYVI